MLQVLAKELAMELQRELVSEFVQLVQSLAMLQVLASATRTVGEKEGVLRLVKVLAKLLAWALAPCWG